jgi:LEA14-like dessication related protein
MKTKMYPIFVFGLCCFLMFAGCESIQQVMKVKKPTASLKAVGFENITLKSATLLFDVEIQNPYPVALPLLNMDYALATGTNKLLSGKADLQTTVAAHDKKVVSLPATISYLELAKAFLGIRPGSKIPYQADVGLSVDTQALGQIRLPLNKTGELSVPAIPEIDKIDWKRLL